MAYEFYKELLWEKLGGLHWQYGYDSVLCLNKMAAVLGKEEDAVHWNETINMENLQWHLNNGWNSSAFMYGLNGKGVAFGNIAPAAISQFPREWVVQMAEHWLDDSEKGFNTWIPLSTRARQDWFEGYGKFFFITPGSSWYMIRPLYIHTVDRLANKFTLNHLKRFNMENGVPVAPEARRKDFTRSGDSYSNINAGKILLVLEGIGGLRYSVHDDSFTFADNLPTPPSTPFFLQPSSAFLSSLFHLTFSHPPSPLIFTPPLSHLIFFYPLLLSPPSPSLLHLISYSLPSPSLPSPHLLFTPPPSHLMFPRGAERSHWFV